MGFETSKKASPSRKQIDEVPAYRAAITERGGAAAKGGEGGGRSSCSIPVTRSWRVPAAVNITFQIGSIITVNDGQKVAVGEVLARIPQESSKTRDITGGLPRVAELFEARSPKDAGVLAEVTGTASFGKETKGKQRLVITDLNRRCARVPDHEGQARDGARRSSSQ